MSKPREEDVVMSDEAEGEGDVSGGGTPDALNEFSEWLAGATASNTPEGYFDWLQNQICPDGSAKDSWLTLWHVSNDPSNDVGWRAVTKASILAKMASFLKAG